MTPIRVCAISDVECSRGCGTGACKKEEKAMNETTKDGERAAFEAWARTADMPLGMYSSTDYADGATQLSWDAWQARAASPQSGEKMAPDEPHNVNGMTRSEFEHFLRIGYQHDNVRDQECGLGPKWPNGQIGLTPQQEREIAERVERNYPTTGTFACPICGKDVPHEHSAEDIVAHRNEQKARAAAPQAALTDELLETARFDESLAIDDEDGELIGCLDWCREFAKIILAQAPTERMSDKDTGEGNEA